VVELSSFTASTAKEKNKVEPDISYSGINRVEKKAAVVPSSICSQGEQN